MMYYPWCEGGVGGTWGGLLSLFFWAIVLFLVVKVVRELTHQKGKGKSALGILEERYARGEINKVESEEKKKDLT
jgi:putative membrane protein